MQRGLALTIALVLLTPSIQGCSPAPRDEAASFWDSREDHVSPNIDSARTAAQSMLPGFIADASSDRPADDLAGARLADLEVDMLPLTFVTPIEADRPLVEQLVPSDLISWPVVDESGAALGSIEISWNGEVWEMVGTSWRGAEDSHDPEAGNPRGIDMSAALLALDEALGAPAEATATVQGPFGTWLIGSRGASEAGVLTRLDPLMFEGPVPIEGRPYDRSTLVEWLRLK